MVDDPPLALPTVLSRELDGEMMLVCLDDAILHKLIDRLPADGPLTNIENLRKAITNGTYHVSATELACKLMSHMRSSYSATLKEDASDLPSPGQP